jgi:flagellar hook-basal body complex protein FliE
MSDLRIKPFDFNQAVARAGLRPDGQPRVEPTAGGGFQSAMTQALKNVSSSQLEAQRLQREVTLDNPNVSLESAVMAQQKASIGFQAVLAVRNRMVSAYTEVMNMQV